MSMSEAEKKTVIKINNIEIGKNISPNGEFFKTIEYLRKIAKAYRDNPKSQDNYLLGAELEKYNAFNINNGSGMFVITI